MFDVGFWELALIGVVALLVVGPERLPALARNVGLWLGKLRRMVAQVKEDIEREVRADEIRRSIEEAKELQDAYHSLEQTRRDFQDATQSAVSTVDETRRSVEEAAGGGRSAPAAPEADPTGASDAAGDGSPPGADGASGQADAGRPDPAPAAPSIANDERPARS